MRKIALKRPLHDALASTPSVHNITTIQALVVVTTPSSKSLLISNDVVVHEFLALRQPQHLSLLVDGIPAAPGQLGATARHS
jgi:hypothetical protein